MDIKKREQRYGIKSLQKDFPTEAKVLEFLFDAQHSRECSCGGSYSLKSGRRQFQCSKCRYQIAPTANTLFHKSDTPLTLWFKAILTFSNAKSGISAKEMERQLEVTYKTAWRMLHLIRKALEQDGKLSGDVEMDTAYFGGKKNAWLCSLSINKKAPNSPGREIEVTWGFFCHYYTSFSRPVIMYIDCEICNRIVSVA